MKLNYGLLKQIVEDLSSKANNNHISNITIINSQDILISFSMYRKERLLISLNHQNPIISLIKYEGNVSTNASQLNDILRKDVRDGTIKDIELVNEDKIVSITFEKSNDYFEKETKRLVLELIPHRPNLLILDDKDVILYTVHSSSLESDRPILKGLKYVVPSKGTNYVTTNESSLIEFKDYANKYLDDAKLKKLNERYEILFKFIKGKIKSLNNKKKVLLAESKEAEAKLSYLDHGNMLLALVDDSDSIKEYIIDKSLSYDDILSAGANANKYFKIYKKAKRTIEMDKVELEKADNEIESLENTLAISKFMNDDELYELAKELMPNKFKSQKKSNKVGISYIEHNGVKIFFGKNSTQNDYLTFRLAKKEHYYFHINKYHGSHVIVMSDKLTNDLIQKACEISLVLSNKEEGSVIYTQVKNIKKGSQPGLAIMASYKEVVLREVSKETIEDIKHSNYQQH